MKKFFIAFLAFALAAGNLFAEVTISGSVIGAWGILNGTSDETEGYPGQEGKKDQLWVWDGPASKTSMATVRGRLDVRASSEDGKLGGWIQLRPGAGIGALGNVWWNPISQVKFTLGNIWSGVYTAGVVSADDNILNSDLYIIHFWGRGHGYSGYRAIQAHGMDIDWGAAVDLYPVDNLHIIAAVPFSQPTNPTTSPAGDVYANTVVKIDYTVPDLLQIIAYFDGGTSRVSIADNTNIDPAYIGVAVNVLAVPNLALSVGGAYPLPATAYHSGQYGTTQSQTVTINGSPTTITLDDTQWQTKNDEVKVQDPIALDLRANYTVADSLNIGFGLGVNLGGSKKFGAADATETPLDLGVTLNPAYTLGNTVIGLVAETQFITAEKDQKNQQVLLNFVPYVQYNMGGGHAVLGFQLGVTHQEGAQDTVFNWSIPAGINYSF